MTKYRRRYARVFRTLSRLELQKGRETDFVTPDLFGPGAEQLFLGFYTREGLRFAFEEYGLFDDLAAAGFTDVRLELLYDDPDEHMLRFWSDSPAVDWAPLLELVVRRDVLVPRAELASRLPQGHLSLLHVEWLQLQNPLATFIATRPPLPGQRFPGLGVGPQVGELLLMACRRLRLDGLANVPSFFHNAAFYERDENWYFDPQEQGLFEALCRDVLPVAGLSPAAASWALKWGHVRDAEGEPVEWFHDVMVGPISEPARRYFEAESYSEERIAERRRHSFTVDVEALHADLARHGISPLDLSRIASWIHD